MHVYVTTHVFEYYAISGALLMFGPDNKKQSIFKFCVFIKQNLHQYAGKTYYYISNYNNNFNYITMCAIVAVIPISSFTIPLTALVCVLVQHYFLQSYFQYI